VCLLREPAEVPSGAAKETACQDSDAKNIGRFDRERVGPAAARPLRRQLESGAQRLEGPIAERAAVLEPLAIDPIDRLLLPHQHERPTSESSEVEHGTVGLRNLLDLMLG